MQLEEILKHIEYLLIFGNTNKQIKSVVCDSRKCQKDCIFVAIKGTENDGHEFISKAVSSGASVVVYEAERGLDISEFQDTEVTFVKVPDSRLCFAELCAILNGFPSKNCNVVGVTGTNGKTSVTYILEHVTDSCAVIGTVNYRFKNKIFPAENTTPDSCTINSNIKKFTEDGAKIVAMEVSSHALDMHRADYIEFNVGIFTNLTPEHLDYHKNIKNYFNVKSRFFTEILHSSHKQNKGAVINIDDDYGKILIKTLKEFQFKDLNIISYGLNSKEADIYFEKINSSLKGTEAILNSFGKKFKLTTSLFGNFNLLNILAVIGACKFLNISEEDVILRLKRNLSIPGRLEKPVKNKNIFIDYAHTEDALKNVLTCLNQVKEKQSKIITVFGCGGDRDKSKREKMGETAAKLSDFVVVTSDNPRTENPLDIIDEIVKGIKGNISENNYRIIPDRKDAIKMSLKLAREKDIVLIAGKGHEDYQIIGTEKIRFSDKEVVSDFFKTNGA